MMKKYPKYFTVKELKDLLVNIPEDLPIGRVGQFLHMSKSDFSVSKAQLVPKHSSWRNKDMQFSFIFEIISPDLGPDPD